MRILPIVTVLILAAAPTLAQDAGRNDAGAKQKPVTAPLIAQMSTVSSQAKEKLRKSLEKAGFRDIEIVDAAYAVHARTQDGSSIVMYVNPPEAGSGAATTGQSRTETPPAPEAPVLNRGNAQMDKLKTPAEKAKPDPYKHQ